MQQTVFSTRATRAAERDSLMKRINVLDVLDYLDEMFAGGLVALVREASEPNASQPTPEPAFDIDAISPALSREEKREAFWQVYREAYKAMNGVYPADRKKPEPTGPDVFTPAPDVFVPQGVRLDRLIASLPVKEDKDRLTVADAHRRVKAGVVKVNGDRFFDLIYPNSRIKDGEFSIEVSGIGPPKGPGVFLVKRGGG